MATGWAEFLRWIRHRVAEDDRDLEATWSRFRKLAANSERVDILKFIVGAGRVLPAHERYRLAVATTRLLAPLEWPRGWSVARPALVVALDTLVEETDPDSDTSFFALHDLGTDAEFQRIGHLVLYGARDLLRRPCRRDELHVVARLCNAGNAACLRAYRRALKRLGADTSSDHDSRARYRSAFEGYTLAADALNDAVGSVLFEGLHAPVP